MYKDIFKRLGIQVLIYLVIFYLIPYISISFFPETIRDMVTALFLVVFDLLIIITISTFDSYKYKLNWFSWIIPGLLFIPSMHLFYSGMDLIVYAILYCASYGVGMLLGWSYRTYGYQLKPGYKKIYKKEKEEESKQKRELKEKKKQEKKESASKTSKKNNTKKKVNK